MRAVLRQVFDSDALPPGDRVDAWRTVVADSLLASRVHVEQPDAFHASMRAGWLGPTLVSVTSYSSMRSLRTTRLIRRSDPELYTVAIPRRGRLALNQFGRQTLAGPGELMIFPTFRPNEGIVRAGESRAESLVCQLPRGLLPLPERRAERLIARRLPTRDAVGPLLIGLLTGIDADADTYLPGDGPRLGVVLLDLIAAFMAHHLGAEDEVPPESRQRALHAQALAFIQRNLGDPGLTPAVVAAAHHVSVRTLHRLFQDHGHSVTAHIRHERLEHARRDLINPALADRPVHAIAARWGFTHPAAFTRAFSTAYGLAPRDYRQQACD